MGIEINSALISAWDKQKILAPAEQLVERGIKIFASSGTAEFLNNEGIQATSVEELVGFDSLLDGRVKTLHPKIFGGALANKDKKAHLQELEEREIPTFDLIMVDLYPFEKGVEEGKSEEELVELIDIGGISLLRAAAKNFKNVVPLSDLASWDKILDEIDRQGEVSEATSRKLAKYTFGYSSYYDTVIHNSLFDSKDDDFGEYYPLSLKKKRELRYGENPHQEGVLYKDFTEKQGIPHAEHHHGKELSYNNIMDLDIVWQTLQEFETPTSVVVKHGSPCGIARNEKLLEAYKNALHSDKLSSFGGIAGFNREITPELAQLLNDHFFAAIISNGFKGEALDLLRKKKRRRILTYDSEENEFDHQLKWVNGGMLVQTPDPKGLPEEDYKVVTETEPTKEQFEQLKFAWRAIKYTKSNSILIAKEDTTVGIGSGCPSRVDASINALRKALDDAQNSVAASDAFMPFPDALQVLADGGVEALIQPGGSKNDQAVIDFANQLNIPMIFTGVRHFKH